MGASPDALLIHGQAGIGKLMLARAFAQSLLCTETAITGHACGKCAACHLFEIGNHPDYRLIQPESAAEEGEEAAKKTAKGKRPSTQIPVIAIRSLTSLVTKVSHSGGAKVVIISPAESMHRSASGALLKMLEEPTRDTHFILVASEIHRILPTISSRCFKLAVKVPPVDEAASWLSQQTDTHVDASLRLSSNAPLAALDLSRNDDFWSCRESLMAAFAESTPDPLQLASGVEKLEPEAIGRLLGTWIYDLLAVQSGGQPRYHAELDSMVRQNAARLSGVELCRWSDELRDYVKAASHPLNKRLALEALFSKWPASKST